MESINNETIEKPVEETWDDIEKQYWEWQNKGGINDKRTPLIQYLKLNYQVPKQIK